MEVDEIMKTAQANIEKELTRKAVEEIEDLLQELCAAKIVVKDTETKIADVKKDLAGKLADIAAA